MDLRLCFAVLVGKVIFYLTRKLKRGGGSAAPGLYALKLYPKLIEKLASQIQKNIVITGTNGKTTTSRMISHILTDQGFKVIKNSTGSNLERGIASALIKYSRLHLEGVKLNFDVGVLELDEASFNKMVPILKPDIVIFLNVFRDQLDRYGEVDSVVKNWCRALDKLSGESEILINGDDASLLLLKNCFRGKVRLFGIEGRKISGERKINQKVKLDFEARDILEKSLEGTSFKFQGSKFNLPVPGNYHVYDATAALSCAYELNLDLSKASESLEGYSPAFGRFERFTLQPSRLTRLTHESQKQNEGYIFLIKNPTGATQVFETLAKELKSGDRLLLALNDNFADGKDVSWIWDAEFEKLKMENLPAGRQGGKLKIICAGTRAYDLANRLKYAGFDVNKMDIISNLHKAFEKSSKDLTGRLFILPTYTALLNLQKILAKKGIKRHYWEESEQSK